MKDLVLGPYWTGALTPKGNSPLWLRPQLGHWVDKTLYSVTSKRGSGISNSWRREITSEGRLLRSHPQVQWRALHSMILSGHDEKSSVFPLWPSFPPRLLPDERGNAGFFPSPSDDGGLLLLWLSRFNLAFNAVFSELNTEFPDRSAWLSDSSSATRASKLETFANNKMTTSLRDDRSSGIFTENNL